MWIHSFIVHGINVPPSVVKVKNKGDAEFALAFFTIIIKSE